MNTKKYQLSFYGDPIFSILLKNTKESRYLDITSFRPDLTKELSTKKTYLCKVFFKKNKIEKLVLNNNDQIVIFKNIR